MTDERAPTSISVWGSDRKIIRQLRSEMIAETDINPNVSDLMRAGLRALEDLSMERRIELIQRARNDRQ